MRNWLGRTKKLSVGYRSEAVSVVVAGADCTGLTFLGRFEG
jgi:hypothetical protein